MRAGKTQSGHRNHGRHGKHRNPYARNSFLPCFPWFFFRLYVKEFRDETINSYFLTYIVSIFNVITIVFSE